MEDTVEEEEVQIGLYSDLPEEDREEALKEAKRILIEKDVYNIDKNLEKDLLVEPNQKYCVVSWVGPTFKAKTGIYGFRIMGAFKTLNGAQKYAHELHKLESTYDIGVMEMNLWCFGYPCPKDGDFTSEEIDQKLNEFIVDHKVELEEKKQLFEFRKRILSKSKITKEGSEGDALIKSVPTGAPTEEMDELHDTEMKKWGIDKDPEEDSEEDVPSFGVKSLSISTEYKIPEQEWAIVSFVGYSGNNKRIPICIKGIYPSEEKARDRIEQLIGVDDTYDIIPMPLYKWVPCDPDLSKVSSKFKDDMLNDFIEQDIKQKDGALSYHQIRKNDGGGGGDEQLLEDTIEEGDTEAIRVQGKLNYA